MAQLKVCDVQEERKAAGNEEGEASGAPAKALQVNLKKLKTQDELRRIFGAKFINSEGRDSDEGMPPICRHETLDCKGPLDNQSKNLLAASPCQPPSTILKQKCEKANRLPSRSSLPRQSRSQMSQ